MLHNKNSFPIRYISQVKSHLCTKMCICHARVAQKNDHSCMDELHSCKDPQLYICLTHLRPRGGCDTYVSSALYVSCVLSFSLYAVTSALTAWFCHFRILRRSAHVVCSACSADQLEVRAYKWCAIFSVHDITACGFARRRHEPIECGNCEQEHAVAARYVDDPSRWLLDLDSR